MTEPTRFSPHIAVFPVRTPTLPPATHTNTWILGDGPYTVVDPASPWTDAREALFAHLQELGDVERIVLTHHHDDHVGGVEDLRDRLGGIEVLAHPLTDALVGFDTTPLEAGDTLRCGTATFDVHHTPGHAPGHIVLLDTASKMLIAGDMVAGVGTIAINPADGHLGTYLDSLAALRTLQPSALLPAHGPVLEQADAVLAFYIAHRNSRTEQIRRALDARGSATPLELAADVYTELDPRFHPLAAVQITSHLIFLQEGGKAQNSAGTWTLRS